jgi:Sec7-like guanine-nucleotide exchange factor
MTIEDYQKNLRGVNDGTDFSPEFLVSHYGFNPRPVLTTSSKISMTPFENGKSSCQKSILDS